ncbi:DNA polymerase/3'-5' exonuclease PolX [Aromatoleum petrolei]|uniref:DNA polymerase beta n=1 Tax=Aromatoleum petrolei TaxID=76116 RepID=A0ABX1MNR6_9RHOO|nr:DNA polymerase/3'-5' exonuclease PolX [Aromatoleum petrolei]NMF87684.1 DNA polymerase/3'-5' exonuclease PolX [Aromatoleum petrolei]QTQ38169.1 DNA polymerase, family X [Aromatoleum petrolei]
MPLHNADIAAIFGEIADLLEIEDANPFRIRAYRRAAQVLGEFGRDLRQMLADGEDLTALPGIGNDLTAKIREIVVTGHCAQLDRLHGELPPAIAELLHIPGLGPKRVRALWHDLDVQTTEQLCRAARDGRIRVLPGFGEKTERRILEAAEVHLARERRFKLATAAQYAEGMVAYLRRVEGVERVEVAGSFRRMRETVGDLDILVIAAAGNAVTEAFVTYDEVREVLAQGNTRASVVLRCGLQVDLRVVAPESYGAALCYFTGSRAHNVALRRGAIAVGLKLNEYGVFRGDQRIAGETEESVYRVLGLAWIPPELREDRGEIEAARRGRLPHLVRREDLRGDLHAHTRATDGHNSLREMALAARDAGLEYLAITEHSRRLAMAHGLDAAGLARQIDEIERLNETLTGIRMLKGIEVDILEDGSLDLPDAILARLDVVVGAVHSRFDLPRTRQTERILRAMESRHFTLLAHPTGRVLDERDPYDVDMSRVIRRARERGCALELNAHPTRLDLLDTWCMAARDEGVPVAINSDAHSVRDFDNLRFGVGQARRGWLEAKDVLNTRPLAVLLAWLKC